MSAQTKVLMYATGVCPYCVRAEQLLRRKGVTEIEKIRVDMDPQQRAFMMERTGRRTVPQIFIGETHVGGCDDLYALEHEGRLDALLAGQ
ncbi:glutaredoxin 3 [Uliginosibacterium sp. sgz301328]|uniref:glutaredoxin 3 n=1 Tax=Uliginosibacterium sp. sgz301328 TaxID=3243764 RepID=UPI00359E5E45